MIQIQRLCHWTESGDDVARGEFGFAGFDGTFTWLPAKVASSYRLDVGTGVGLTDIYTKNVVLATSQAVSGIPANGSTIHVRLSTVAGRWCSITTTRIRRRRRRLRRARRSCRRSHRNREVSGIGGTIRGVNLTLRAVLHGVAFFIIELAFISINCRPCERCEKTNLNPLRPRNNRGLHLRRVSFPCASYPVHLDVADRSWPAELFAEGYS